MDHYDFTMVAPKRMIFLVMQLLVDPSVLLPECGSLLLGLSRLVYPNLQTLHLAAWRLRISLCRRGTFREVAATISAAHRPSTLNLHHVK